MHYVAALRQGRKADGLIVEASQATDPGERDRLEARARMTYEAAVVEFAHATKTSPQWLDPYAPLGAALRALERHQEALEVHMAALEIDPSSDENFLGWVDCIFELGMLGDATAAYEELLETHPERAEILGTAIERWFEEHRADPAGIDPAHLERLAVWIAARDLRRR
jgi:tetratricopeptide (TPR) repeat protein